MWSAALVPVLLAAVVSALLGFVWYHPRAFGSSWMRLSGISPEAVELGRRRMHRNAALALLAGAVAALVLRAFEIGLGVYDVRGAVQVGFFAWLGFVAPALLGVVLWEQKPFFLYVINAGYWLVSLLAMSVILIFA